MKKLLLILALLVSSIALPAAHALTLPPSTDLYFVGTTAQLYKIRAALGALDCADNPQIETCVFTGGPPTCSWGVNPHCDASVVGAPYTGYWQVVPAPWGLGAVDCMTAYTSTTGSFLGRTATVDNEQVTVPSYEELASYQTWPGECYGYQFHAQCSDAFFGPWFCPDPLP